MKPEHIKPDPALISLVSRIMTQNEQVLKMNEKLIEELSRVYSIMHMPQQAGNEGV